MVFSVIFLSIRMMYIMPMYTRMSAVDRCERFVSFENRVESVRSNNTEIIAECRRYFQFNLPIELIEKKETKFEENYNRCVLVLRDICVRLS